MKPKKFLPVFCLLLCICLAAVFIPKQKATTSTPEESAVPSSEEPTVPITEETTIPSSEEPTVPIPEETTFPRMDIEGNISGMTQKKDVRRITVSYDDGRNSFWVFADLKVQGTSSLMYDKKNYTIKLYRDPEHEEKMAVDMGWGAQSEYCLKANWIDKTHARNIVTARLAAEVQAKYGLLQEAPHNGTVDGFPVEIYSNGDFLGIYTFNIPKAEWLFGMDAENPDHIVLCGEDWLPAVLFEELPTPEAWSVEVGPEDGSALEKAAPLFDFVMNSSDQEFREQFARHMDLDSALNYYILTDLACLRDNTGKNMLLVTYDGTYWYPSLYDLDTSWGTNWKGTDTYEYTDDPFAHHQSRLLSRLEDVFSRELSDRYWELRQTILTKEHIMECFTEFTAQIPEEVRAREIEKWGPEIPGYEITQIGEFLDVRLPLLDEKYEAMGTSET